MHAAALAEKRREFLCIRFLLLLSWTVLGGMFDAPANRNARSEHPRGAESAFGWSDQ